MADTELAKAAKAGDAAKVAQLLSAGANVNANDRSDLWERTALMEAARMGHADVVKLLIAKGADVNKQGDGTGATPLRASAYKGYADVVKALLAAGAAPDSDTDEQGRTPLVWSVISKEKNAPAVIELLLKAGANSDAAFVSFDGKTKTPVAVLAREAGPAINAAFKNNLKR